MDQRTVVVLGVHHALQGAEKVPAWKKIDDPTYARLLVKLIHDFSIDYIFEEACGLGPTTASMLQSADVRYSDVDPPGPERFRLGMPQGLSELHQALWREQLWVRTINDASFRNGLMICGLAHTMSVAARLDERGCSVDLRMYVVPEELPASPEVAVAMLNVLRQG